jgi:hypothetical protein|tara:strand:- start:3617 stop:3910 length:294 start_codon:yes stop_codon:yes gene_type:complete
MIICIFYYKYWLEISVICVIVCGCSFKICCFSRESTNYTLSPIISPQVGIPLYPICPVIEGYNIQIGENSYDNTNIELPIAIELHTPQSTRITEVYT